MSKVWLVTGCNGGLGRAIARHVLDQGDRLVATARKTDTLASLRRSHPDQVAVCELDVTDPAQAAQSVEFARDTFGRLDVLVNNAGFAAVGAFEQMPATQFAAQIDTNFHGVVNLVRAVLPLMRAQRAGHIINVSSGAGRLGAPGLAAYHAAKWAVGGFTESVAAEVRGLGIHVVALEPGSMPTNWAASAAAEAVAPLDDYADSVGRIQDVLKALVGHEVGDLARYAKVIFELSRAEELPAHLILGSDALQAIRVVEEKRALAALAWESVTRSTDRQGATLEFLAAVPAH